MPINRIDRRTCLKGVGISMALPCLEIMADEKHFDTAKNQEQRIVLMSIPFGVVQEKFHPKATGYNYEMSETLAPMADMRDDFTVFSHLQHDVRGGHAAVSTLLNGVLPTHRARYPEGNMTLDQAIVERRGHLTRFGSLCFGRSYSFTRTGVNVPSITSPADIFRLLFVDETEAQKQSVKRSLANSASILDVVRADAKVLEKRLGKRDREKLDDYFTSIRGTEKKFDISKSWLDIPKPRIDAGKYADLTEMDDKLPAEMLMQAYLELTYLALQTDSARIVANGLGNGNFKLEGVTDGYHTCSHHGMRPEYLKQLAITEQFMMTELGKFIKRVKETEMPDGESMLKSTQILFGSALGSGSRHTNTNPPIVLAGGRYKHGQHVNAQTKQPLCNLLHSMMEHTLDDEIKRFSVSTGRLSGLDLNA